MIEEIEEDLNSRLDEKCKVCSHLNGDCPKQEPKCSADTGFYKFEGAKE